MKYQLREQGAAEMAYLFGEAGEENMTVLVSGLDMRKGLFHSGHIPVFIHLDGQEKNKCHFCWNWKSGK